MFANDIHTDYDLAHFAEKGIDPATREPRHHPVKCLFCGPLARATMNRSGLCDRHDALVSDAAKDVAEPRGGLGRR